MYPRDGRVDHLDGGIMSDSKRVHEPAPYASSPPADEAVIAGSIWAITFRQITPWRARSRHPKDAVEDTSIIHSGTPRAFFGNIGLMVDHSYSVSSYASFELRLGTMVLL